MIDSPNISFDQARLETPAHNPPGDFAGQSATDLWLRDLIKDRKLTAATLRVGIMIAMNFDCITGRQRSPGFTTLATHIGISKQAVMNCIHLLEAQGWLAVDRTSGIKNAYTLLRMPVAS
jgi:hypothetical protein